MVSSSQQDGGGTDSPSAASTLVLPTNRHGYYEPSYSSVKRQLFPEGTVPVSTASSHTESEPTKTGPKTDRKETWQDHSGLPSKPSASPIQGYPDDPFNTDLGEASGTKAEEGTQSKKALTPVTPPPHGLVKPDPSAFLSSTTAPLARAPDTVPAPPRAVKYPKNRFDPNKSPRSYPESPCARYSLSNPPSAPRKPAPRRSQQIHPTPIGAPPALLGSSAASSRGATSSQRAFSEPSYEESFGSCYPTPAGGSNGSRWGRDGQLGPESVQRNLMSAFSTVSAAEKRKGKGPAGDEAGDDASYQHDSKRLRSAPSAKGSNTKGFLIPEDDESSSPLARKTRVSIAPGAIPDIDEDDDFHPMLNTPTRPPPKFTTSTHTKLLQTLDRTSAPSEEQDPQEPPQKKRKQSQPTQHQPTSKLDNLLLASLRDWAEKREATDRRAGRVVDSHGHAPDHPHHQWAIPKPDPRAFHPPPPPTIDKAAEAVLQQLSSEAPLPEDDEDDGFWSLEASSPVKGDDGVGHDAGSGEKRKRVLEEDQQEDEEGSAKKVKADGWRLLEVGVLD
ncbi:hypothetical protein HK097_006640 [Rhizophlyctis rosea]|uniref:Uncharacterized protein n=1 Tax=Rhizophlyctis rosea TaxID=64517 RepID=A0AAD5SFJ6_9FUNG|nr:hypothetical protein HK097_006640 [Rhizophlyctis rosea]